VAGMPPAPQGSKRHVGNGRLIESSKHVKPWRYLVSQAAIATNHPTITSPVSLTITFLFPRPKAHYTTKGILKPSAPTHHSTRPDASKCLRSTEDALVDAGLLQDDALVALASITKRYTTPAEHPGAIITITTLAAT
ncbi:MAG: RusA family crossover junction endodeoxyribonuclease, partial [Vulcanococcus sp.]